MKVLTPGHLYFLLNAQGAVRSSRGIETTGQQLQFLERRDDGTVIDGVTSEEVLNVLIDSLKDGNRRVPSRETSVAITKCEEALMWLEKRTRDRIARGVKGTFEK